MFERAGSRRGGAKPRQGQQQEQDQRASKPILRVERKVRDRWLPSCSLQKRENYCSIC